ncbi:hypothetical protein SB18R_24230 [Pseudomonas oryzihabitans]|nr:hypothetical protein SB18R_24230 [Pseudomonas psychrotolerans]
MAIPGVRFVPLRLKRGSAAGRLPLAAAWLKGSRDPVRDQVIAVLEARLKSYARWALRLSPSSFRGSRSESPESIGPHFQTMNGFRARR